MLAFIHLSDIHFTKYSGDQYDIDQDLRDELLRDIFCYHRSYWQWKDNVGYSDLSYFFERKL